ncbi:MAG: hypothetical protein DRI46_10030 [Chloroflexi bacterium]|nr:MAG: hypothetical protein DRI46_10030 [Chloroflexota bacterium]
MLEWRKYSDKGQPGFANEGNDFSVLTEPNERGRWLGLWDKPVEPGEKLHIQVETEGPAEVVVTFWSGPPGSNTFLQGVHIPGEQVNEIVTVVEKATRVRIELRNWGTGFAKFHALQFEYPYKEIEPDPPLPPETDLPYYNVYNCYSPSQDTMYIVTVSDTGASIALDQNRDTPFSLVDELAATEPDEPAFILEHGVDDVIQQP